MLYQLFAENIHDYELDLPSGDVSSPVVVRIFPTQTNQLILRHIRKFMLPDSSALQYVKEFLRKVATTQMGIL